MNYSKFFSCENLDVFNTNLEAGIVDDLSLVFISSTKQIWTHGTFYNCPYSAEEVAKLVSDSEDRLTEMINSLKAVATTGKDGLMSASDKTKLDSLEKITVDSALSSTSTNPVENKAINTALAGKSDSGHTHNYAGSSSAGGAANSVKSSMTLKVNGGNTEGTSKYTFNGSAAKTLDIKAGDNVTLSTASGSLTINAKDTTYGEATQSSAGLMSAADKVRLEGLVSTGGEPNQNAFANVKVGTTVIESENISDTLELAAGDNVTLTPDATNDKVTIAAKDTTYTAGDGLSLSGTEFSHADTSTLSGSYGPTANVTGSEGKTIVVPQITVDEYGHVTGVTNRTYTSKDTTYSNATTTANGLMSSTDKSKLNGIDEGANNYSHPTYTAQTGKPTANQTPGFGGTFTVSQVTSDGTGHVTGMTDRTVTIPSSTASTTAAGLMSKDDKTKLNGIEAGAQVNTVTGVKGSSESTYRTGNINITKANIGLGNVTNESKATMFTNAALTGTPTAPTAASGTNTTQIATTAFVQSAIDTKIAAADAMIYKGTVDAADELPSTTAKTGWTYKVTTAGTYAGEECEVGDMIICLTDGSSTTAATWSVVQTNIDGAVTGPNSSVNNRVATFNGTTGKVIKDSGYTIAASVPSGAKFTDTTYTAGNGLSLSGTEFSHADTSTLSGNYGPTANVTGSEGKTIVVPQITVDGYGHVTGVTNRTYTSKDTTYGEATTSKAGLMSAADKTRLEGLVSTGGEPNQNAYSKVTVGDVTLEADNIVDTLVLEAGSNVTLTPDATNDKVTIAAKDTTYTAGEGVVLNSTEFSLDESGASAGTYGPTAAVTGNNNSTMNVPSITVDKYGRVTSISNKVYTAKNTTYSSMTAAVATTGTETTGKLISAKVLNDKINEKLPTAATTTADGLMSASDKAKLDGIAEGANNYTHPTYTAKSAGFYKVTVDGTGHVSATSNVAKSDITALGIPGSDTTYTFTGGTNKFTVTPSSGDAVDVAVTPSISNNVTYSGTLTSGQVAVYDGTAGKIKASGYTIASSVPSGAKFTDTNTKVTSVSNHYEPVANDDEAISVDANSSTAATWGTTSLVTGVNLQRDAAGHVTGMTVDSIKMPANPNSNTTYTFANGSAGNFTVTPLNGSAQTVSVGKPSTAGTADKVASSLTLKIKSGTTEGTSLYTFNGSSAKTLDIKQGANVTLTAASGSLTIAATDTTYSAISASELSTGTATTSRVVTAKVISDYVKGQIDTKIAAADAMIYKGTIGTDGTVTALPTTHTTGWTYKVITAGTYAGQACEVGDMIICLTDGTAANNAHWTVVQNNIDGAVTGPASSTDAHIAVFNGATGKVIKDSGFTIGKSVPSNAVFTDTTYSAGTGLSLSGTTFNHSNSVTAKTAYGSTTTTASANGGKIVVTDVKYDAQGHITASTDRTITLSQDHTKTSITAGTAGTSSATSGITLAIPYVSLNANGHATGYGTHTHTIPAMTAATSSAAGTSGLVPAPGSGKQASFLRGDGTWVVPTNTTYTAGTGLTLDGTTFKHSNSVTAGTAGTSSATSGATLAVPYVTYDAQGHITKTGTHTHTITGFLTEETYKGTVTSIKVGTTSYSQTSGVVSLPAYPTTLPASDVSSWAKAASKPTYTYSEVGAAPASHTQAYTTLTGSGTTADQAIVSTGTANGWTLKTLGSNAFTSTTIPTNTNQLTNGAGFTTNTGTVTSVTLTQGTGITVSNSGTAITTSGTRTISLATVLSAAANAGPTAAVTGNEGTTVAIPRISVDTYGRVTALSSYNLTCKNTTYSVATASANGLMAAADKSLTDFLNATGTATTLASLDVSKSTIYATLSAATSISLSGTLAVGRSITVICLPSATFTQPIPTTGSFVSMDGDSLSVTSGKLFEFNVYCYTSGKYSISCKTAK